ncbi:hypothetical protein LPTSP3_g02980 [Leptospira kobayashii]|uniref:Beta-propeller repeat protein n=1 Tax=Leptospira kobayashii TaxID=1917830 RepID=A0ABN6K8U0_9LEPT|nr:SBBP repeat-containing protein [Leptospira kobayashii]BDA77368.1 hypothetical protein LPTSP3_g02980 [Leptospira kobayashii]
MTKFKHSILIVVIYSFGVSFSFGCKSSSDDINPLWAIPFLTGATQGTSDSIPAINNSGTKEWTRLLGAGGGVGTRGNAITSDSSGNIYITGYTQGNLDGQTLTGSNDLLITKYSSAGNRQWTRLLGVASASTIGNAVISGSSGIYITGITGGNLDGQTKTGSNDLFLIKYDNSGNKQWTRLLGVASAETTGNAITSDGSGYIYITGYTQGNLDGQTLTGSKDLFITKYDSNGNKQWTKLLGVASASTFARGIISDNSGTLYITGTTNGNLDGQTKTGSNDMVIAKFDNNGNKEWIRLLGVTNSTTEGFGIVRDSSSNIYITGNTQGNLDGQTLAGSKDLFVVKYDANGNKQWTKLSGVTNGHITEVLTITNDSFGNVYTAGSTTGGLDGQTITGGKDLFVVKYDKNGNKQWTRLMGVASSGTNSYGIVSDSFGYLYTTGSTSGNLDGQIKTGGEDLFIVKYK